MDLTDRLLEHDHWLTGRLVFSAHRRQVLAGTLEELGVEGIEPLDPIEWEQRAAARGAGLARAGDLA